MARTPFYDPNDPRQNPTGEGAEDPAGTAARAREDAASGMSKGNLGAPVYGNTPDGSAAREAKEQSIGISDANRPAQDLIGRAASYGQQQASANRGPQATEDVGLANNVSGRAGGNQVGAIELAKRMAMGSSPSQGALQLQAGLNAGSAQQKAMAAGGRGSAALATAGANSAANISNLQQNAYTGAGLLRSQDMAQGRGIYGTLTDQATRQANARVGQANDFGNANAARNDAYSVGMGNAAVGAGQVANGFNMGNLSDVKASDEVQGATDDANQDYNMYVGGVRRTNEANYQDDQK